MSKHLLTGALWALAGAVVTIIAAPLYPAGLPDVSIGLSCLGIALMVGHFVFDRQAVPALGLGVFLALVLVMPALAADGAAVTIPYGELVTEVSHIASAVLTPLLIALLAKMTGPVGLFLRTLLGERLIRNARDYALNSVEGAMKGKALSVPVGSVALAVALQYAMDEGPAWLIKTLGGPDGIKNKLFRALDFDADASREAVEGALATLAR
jgi:hypothetical protein